jgi:hypothetical protein
MNLYSIRSDSSAALGTLHPPPSILPWRALARSILCLVALLALLAALHPAAAYACNVPVFRYALEKWRPDAYELIVFHDAPLSAAGTAAVEQIKKQSAAHGGHANLAVTVADVNALQHEAIRKIWENQQPPPSLPWLVLQTPVASPRPTNLWTGKLEDFEVAQATVSPARVELTRRLLDGDAIVWLLLPGSDEAATAGVREALVTRLKELESEIELPEGIGEPGSEVEAPLPVAIRFSVLEIDRADPGEQIFLKQLLFATPALAASEGPLVIPVFGAGRALDVLAGDELEPKVIEQAAKFLCGACSCLVKEQNPGFDLLLNADWDSIFAAGAPRLASETKRAASQDAEYVPIAAGSASTPPVLPAPVAQTVAVPTRTIAYPMWLIVGTGALGLILIGLLVTAVVASMSRSGPRERD